jgi:hypothetical protein
MRCLTADRRPETFDASGVPAVRAEITPVEPVWVMPAKGERHDSCWRSKFAELP